MISITQEHALRGGGRGGGGGGGAGGGVIRIALVCSMLVSICTLSKVRLIFWRVACRWSSSAAAFIFLNK
jgi:hypothetical protein